MSAERIYEFVGPLGDVAGWIERDGIAVCVVLLDDDGGQVSLALTPETAKLTAVALRVAAEETS